MSGGPVLENSLPAFAAAVDQGLGIECDVQLSRDGAAMVFHDWTLERLTGQAGRVDARSADELAAIALNGANGTIPRLEELLALVRGRVPLLIEVKTENARVERRCRAVRDALTGYPGPVAVMSFNPLVSAWFRVHAPAVVRGLVVTEEKRPGRRGDIERRLSLWQARPDFLAYDVRDLPSRFAQAQRRRGLPVLSWTVRTPAQSDTVAAHADAPIFERPREGLA